MQEGRETPPPHYAENLVTRERVDPIYSSIRVHDSTLHSRDKFSVIENGFQENLMASNTRSWSQSSCPIILLPNDCVIFHASDSRTLPSSRHSLDNTQSDTKKNYVGVVNNAGPENHNDDLQSMSSWTSCSSGELTIPDEDHVSSNVQVTLEENILYEEPDKVLQKYKSHEHPTENDRPFETQESVITSIEYLCITEAIPNDQEIETTDNCVQSANETDNVNANDGDNRGNKDGVFDNRKVNHNNADVEHIYESPDSVIQEARQPCTEYYENAYDLPKDMLTKCLEKPNRYALKHAMLHVDENDSPQEEPGINLGMEFVNNSEILLEGEDVKLWPSKKSILYLQQMEEKSNEQGSNC
ncbi:uncharacterized protein LOC124435518 isoform X2 [Xenia sp. Carnegie-2017]|nr:uncharacterized protein LOC124435518 isoform X2 [Xenia sp. Carnegie-2017]